MKYMPMMGSALFTFLGKAVDFGVKALLKLPSVIGAFLMSLGPMILSVGGKAMPAIGSSLLTFGGWIVSGLAAFVPWFAETLRGLFIGTFKLLAEGLGFALGFIVRVFSNLPTLIGELFIRLGPALAGVATWVWDKIIEFFTGGLPRLQAWAWDLGERLWKWLKDVDWGKSAGAMVDGLLLAVGKAGERLAKIAGDLGDKFMQGFNKAMGINSPAKRTFIAGVYIVDGLINSVVAGGPRATKAAGGLADATMGGFTNRRPPRRGYGGGSTPAPPGYGSMGGDGQSRTVEFRGDREVLKFLRTLVKGAGGVDVVFGGRA
jgi:hypothetical protein